MLCRLKLSVGLDLEEGEELMVADFVYVARDRATMQSIKVPALAPQTAEQRAMFAEGKMNAALKREMSKRFLTRTAADETAVAKQLERGLCAADLPALWNARNEVLMPTTVLENTTLTKPQHRNTAGRVFGGYLMRQCYELAFNTCYVFSGRHPTFERITEFIFRRAVEVGSILRLKSRVLKTFGTKCVVEVLVRVVQPDRNTSFDVNSIIVIFDAGVQLPEVLPSTKSEARAQWIISEQCEIGQWV